MTHRDRPLLNEALYLARRYWGYTQTELAELLGVSQVMVSEIERGAKSVSMDMLDRYSRALGVRKSQLMFFAEEMESVEPVSRRRTIVAGSVLSILRRLKPDEEATEQAG